jgi:hypothetical protein
MKAILYKLKEGYVLYSKKCIEPNSLYINNGVLFTSDSVYDEGNNPNSSNPNVTDHNYKVLSQSPDFSLLSEEDAKRIGWFDVEGLAYRHRRSYQDSFEGMNECIMNDAIHQQRGYVAGFQKHAELTSDRRFTEDDIKQAFNDGMKNAWKTISEKILPEEYIKSLSQPKSWEVEYKEENGVYKVTKIL